MSWSLPSIEAQCWETRHKENDVEMFLWILLMSVGGGVIFALATDPIDGVGFLFNWIFGAIGIYIIATAGVWVFGGFADPTSEVAQEVPFTVEQVALEPSVEETTEISEPPPQAFDFGSVSDFGQQKVEVGKFGGESKK